MARGDRVTPAASPADPPPTEATAASPPPPPTLTPAPPPNPSDAVSAGTTKKKKPKPTGVELELSVLSQIRRRLDRLPTAKAKKRCVEMLTEYYVESMATATPPAGE